MIPFHVGRTLYQAGRLARLEKGEVGSLDDLWFADLPTANHHDIYAHSDWVRHVTLFMMAMEGRITSGSGSVGTTTTTTSSSCQHSEECLSTSP